MKKNGSLKLQQWKTKDYVFNFFVYLLNTLLIAGIYLLIFFLNRENTALALKDYLYSVKEPLHIFILMALLSVIMFLYYYLFNRDFLRTSINSQMMFLIIELGIILNFLFGHYINVYLRPVSIVALLTVFLVDQKGAVFNSTLYCFYMFLVDYFTELVSIDLGYVLLIISFVSGIVAVLIVDKAFSRSRLLLKSLAMSFCSIIGLGATLVISDSFNFSDIVISLACAFCSGPLAIALFMTLLPFFETLFNKITRFKLSELTDHKSKLIRRLIDEAPGTFNHSIVVSNIAEACATAIGEDALLARTCAYYHDLGKLRHPEYFTENNVSGENPHDNLTPELSTNIIKSHTIDGYNLLIKHNLPKVIADVCREHHGTMPIMYFYEKAKKFTDGEVNILNYCYQGPKPQTKISAIIMIADSAEAAVRTLTDRSIENVRKTVEKIVDDRIEFGQFDDCDITLKELNIIANAVVNNVTGIYHSRVEYPKSFVKKEEAVNVKEQNNG